jgi:hypothetical protein
VIKKEGDKRRMIVDLYISIYKKNYIRVISIRIRILRPLLRIKLRRARQGYAGQAKKRVSLRSLLLKRGIRMGKRIKAVKNKRLHQHKHAYNLPIERPARSGKN